MRVCIAKFAETILIRFRLSGYDSPEYECLLSFYWEPTKPVVENCIPESLLANVDVRRICLIKPSALGDIVQTLPLLPVLKERFPAAKISWVINHGLRELLEGHSQLDEIISYERRGSWGTSWSLLRELRRKRFDLVFDLQGLLRSGVMAVATGAPLRVGLESAREGAGIACHLTLSGSHRLVPAHARYWRVAEALGLGDREQRAEIPISEEARDWSASQFSERNGFEGPILAVNPGTRWITKRWPIEHFAVVIAKAVRNFGFSVVIVGSPDEQPLAAQLEELLLKFNCSMPLKNLVGQTTLKQLAAVLDSADFLLTNDSGPMHLAAGLGTPVLGIFTCTDPVRSGPADRKHELVTTGLSCASCYKKRCRYRGKKKMACLEEISTNRVWLAFLQLAERHSLQPSGLQQQQNVPISAQSLRRSA